METIVMEATLMKREDIWMIGLVAFSILWTASFGWGIFG
jgi:hypothetical protein